MKANPEAEPPLQGSWRDQRWSQLGISRTRPNLYLALSGPPSGSHEAPDDSMTFSRGQHETIERMSVARHLPELIVADAAGWRAWLAQHHAQPGGVLLVLAKTGVVEPTNLTYGEALEEALCHGWIDGQLQRRDETTYYRRFTPRRPSSAGHGETWRSSIACSRRVE